MYTQSRLNSCSKLKISFYFNTRSKEYCVVQSFHLVYYKQLISHLTTAMGIKLPRDLRNWHIHTCSNFLSTYQRSHLLASCFCPAVNFTDSTQIIPSTSCWTLNNSLIHRVHFSSFPFQSVQITTFVSCLINELFVSWRCIHFKNCRCSCCVFNCTFYMSLMLHFIT